jgi:uncharacterized hydantoinase/oxoprolinase family protein
MTGELVDLFVDRAQGVYDIIALMQQVLAQPSFAVYAGQLGFVAADAIDCRLINARIRTR